MISHEHRFIFIHIPKCAGTSVEQYFGHFDEYSGRNRQDHRTIREIERPIGAAAFGSAGNLHMLARRAGRRIKPTQNPRNKRRVTAEQFRSYLKFTIVRDPWSRLESWYRNVMRSDLHQKAYGSHETLEGFLRTHAGRGSLAPIEQWISRFDGSSAMDLIIRFDRMEEGLRELAAALGRERIDLPHMLNTGQEDRDLDAVYTEGAREIVARVYAREIAEFGFEFPSGNRN